MTYHNEILQAMPIQQQIQAVYWQTKPPLLLRERVLGWLRIRKHEMQDDGMCRKHNTLPEQYVLPACWDNETHCWEDATSPDNFLGLEFDGKEETWNSEIEWFKQVREKRKEAKPDA